MKIFQKLILLTFLFISLGLIWFYFFGRLSFSDTDWPIKEKSRYLFAYNHQLLQKFTADRNNLSQIKIFFPDSEIEIEDYLQLKLMDDNCRETLRENNLSIHKIDSEEPVSFLFDKLSDSRDKVFCLSVSFISETAGKKVDVNLTKNPAPGSISLFSTSRQGEIKNKALMMRPVYVNNNIWQDMQELNQRISQYKPWFLKHYFLYFIAFGFILLSIATVVILILV